MVSLTLAAFAQAKPRLAILPFVGGTGGDGETIATLFSFQADIQGAFTVVPRTSAVNAVIAEQAFQESGYTDSDALARIGHMLNADFVVSGHIRRFVDRNLLITSIVEVETFEQMAGDYREYRTIEEIPTLLPEVSRKMIIAAKKNTFLLPKLAVAPFYIANKGVNERDAEVLAQILAIEIINTGRYAVLPRTSTMQAALDELGIQKSGYTSDEGAKALGNAAKAEYVLSVEVRSLGSINMFIAQILHVNGSLLAGDTRNYKVVEDGMQLMPDLALLLADRAGAQALFDVRASEEDIRRKQQIRAAFFADPARLWSAGVSAGTSFATPWVIGTVRGTLAPWKHMFFDIGLDAGFITQIEGAGYWSLYPFVRYAAFVPFAKRGGWYIGAGGGVMLAEYTFDDLTQSKTVYAAEVATGFLFFDFLDISYTLRTDFASVGHKMAVGYVYRFK
jgi:TolB-like protein